MKPEPTRPPPVAQGLIPTCALLLGVLFLFCLPGVLAHGVHEDDAGLLEGAEGLHFWAFLLLGAKHMVTGWDHVLFLAAVVFFLHRPRHVVLYVTLFTVGHSLTLLLGVLAGIQANANLIDAVIGLSVVYKALDNLGAFERVLSRRPDTRAAVLVFGLFHGFGLATALQELSLSPDGLVGNLLSFNLGVELGQILVLLAILPVLFLWRRHADFARHAVPLNVLIMAGGFVLVAHQLVAFLMGGR